MNRLLTTETRTRAGRTIVFLGLAALLLFGLAGCSSRNALMRASHDGNSYKVLKLLSKGIYDINAKDDTGRTALMLAAGWGESQKVVELLAENGADVNAKDRYGYSSLMLATTFGKNPAIVEKLLENGADVNTKNDLGYTVLMTAAHHNRFDIAQILLDHGADQTLMLRQKESAYEMAARLGNYEFTNKMDKWNELHDWERVKQTGAIVDLQKFIKDYPRSEHVSEASKLVEQLQRERDWNVAVGKNTAEGYEHFLMQHPLSNQTRDARKRLAMLLRDKERNLRVRLENNIAKAKQLKEPVIGEGDIANHITIETSHSLLTYNNATVLKSGLSYARTPSQGNTWGPILPTWYKIVQVKNIPIGLEDIIAHYEQKETPVGYVIDGSRRLTLIIPKEIVPCELEFRGLLYSHVHVR